MRGTTRIDPSSDGSEDVEPTENVDSETAASADNNPLSKITVAAPASSTDLNNDNPDKDIAKEPNSRSDYPTYTRLSRCQSLDSQKQSDRSRKETSSRRASVNSVGILPAPDEASETRNDSTSARRDSDYSESGVPMEGANRSKRVWKALNQASHDINRESRRMLSFIRKRLRSRRGQQETSVKEISISPDADVDQWACRSVSATSTSSQPSFRQGGANDVTNPHVVHDMNDEYNPEYR